MPACQPAILQDVPEIGRYLFFSIADPALPALRLALQRQVAIADGERVVVGLGTALVRALGAQVPGLHEFQALSGPGVTVPSTPAALCCWLRGRETGDLIHLTRALQQALRPALRLDQALDAFRHGRGPNGHGRDLTGYEDGTENPGGDAAVAAALVQGGGAGFDGGSFMAVQQWEHDLDAFDAMSRTAQDHLVGRRRSDNEELDDAPASAHVRRVAQEDFDPEAFVVRRSMPWVAGGQAGLVFVAFGKSFDAFEAQLRRMAGLDDGVVDALFRISRPLTGGQFWCPPMAAGRLDLRHLSLSGSATE